jgi:hypothetical protein
LLLFSDSIKDFHGEYVFPNFPFAFRSVPIALHTPRRSSLMLAYPLLKVSRLAYIYSIILSMYNAIYVDLA